MQLFFSLICPLYFYLTDPQYISLYLKAHFHPCIFHPINSLGIILIGRPWILRQYLYQNLPMFFRNQLHPDIRDLHKKIIFLHSLC